MPDPLKTSPLLNIAGEARTPLVAGFRFLTVPNFDGDTSGRALWRLLKVFPAVEYGRELHVTGVSYRLWPGQGESSPVAIWGGTANARPFGWKAGSFVSSSRPMNTWFVVGVNFQKFASENAWTRYKCRLPGLSTVEEAGPDFISAEPIPEGDCSAPETTRQVPIFHSLAPDVVRVRQGESLCVAMVVSSGLAQAWTAGTIHGAASIQIHTRSPIDLIESAR